jgi:hypothetical protein
MSSLLMEESSYSRDKHMRREFILKRQTHEKRAHIQETNTLEESSYYRDKHMRRELIFKRQTHEKRAHTLSSNVFVS